MFLPLSLTRRLPEQQAMPRIKLTKRAIDQIKSPKEGEDDVIYWDETLSRFGLRVKSSGVKTYIIQFYAKGQSRRLSLGQHGVLTPEQARSLAQCKLGDVAHGHDPAKERIDGINAPTVSRLGKEYLERHAIPLKREKSIRDDRSMLNLCIYPKLGSKQVIAVQRKDIESIHKWLRPTPYRANRVLALLSKMFSLAIGWQWRTDNPAKGIQRFAEAKRERWLNEDELARLGTALASHPNLRATRAIVLMLLTGARKSEVLKAKWEQFDLDRADGGYWTKPAHFTKQKRLHGVPLSVDASDLLRRMLVESDGNSCFVFPGEKPGQPLQEIKGFWKGVCEQANIKDFHIHDLRHTFASRLVSRGEGLHAVGRLLGHTQPQTTARYAHLADDPLRNALKKLDIKLLSQPQ
jgi:integrase